LGFQGLWRKEEGKKEEGKREKEGEVEVGA